MECKHSYFQLVNGVLICAQCGRAASEIKKPKIEDKIGDRPEVKLNVPPVKSGTDKTKMRR